MDPGGAAALSAVLGFDISPIKSKYMSADQKDIDALQAKREMTFGEKLVGINFNPANDDKVSKAKRLCAELADLLNEEESTREVSRHSHLIFQQAVGEILNAQMNVVKYLTLKY